MTVTREFFTVITIQTKNSTHNDKRSARQSREHTQRPNSFPLSNKHWFSTWLRLLSPMKHDEARTAVTSLKYLLRAKKKLVS